MTSRRILTAMLAVAALTAAGCSQTSATPDDPHSRSAHPASQATAKATSVSSPSVAADRPTATPPADPGGVPAGPIPRPALIDDTNPDQVASAAVIALFTVDADTDTDPGDAYLRAAPWLTDKLANDLAATPPTSGTAWLDLAAHRGYTTVSGVSVTSEFGQPKDSAAAAYRAVTYTVKNHYRDSSAPPRDTTATRFLQLETAGGVWRVSRFAS